MHDFHSENFVILCANRVSRNCICTFAILDQSALKITLRFH